MTAVSSPWRISTVEARLRDLRVVAQMISAMSRSCHAGMPDGTVMLVLQREGFAGGEIGRLWPLLRATVEAIVATQPQAVEARA